MEMLSQPVDLSLSSWIYICCLGVWRSELLLRSLPSWGGTTLPVVSSLVHAQLEYGFHTTGRWEKHSFKPSETEAEAASWAEKAVQKKKNTYGSGFNVSSAEFNLFAYSVTDGQNHSIYNYSRLYSSCSNSFHWFIYKTLLCTLFFFHFSAMSRSFNKHVTKKVL